MKNKKKKGFYVDFRIMQVINNNKFRFGKGSRPLYAKIHSLSK